MISILKLYKILIYNSRKLQNVGYPIRKNLKNKIKVKIVKFSFYSDFFYLNIEKLIGHKTVNFI